MSKLLHRLMNWATTLLMFFAAEQAFCSEIRTYEFESSGTFPYTSSCGECSRWFNVQADIAGTFTVEIDTTNRRGVLLDLSAQITDLNEVIFSIGPFLNKYEEEPVFQYHYHFEPIPIESYGSELNFDWVLGGSGWEGILSGDEGTLELSSHSSELQNSNYPFLILPSPGYAITLGDESYFSMWYSAIDLSFGISLLEVTRVIPEPRTFALVSLALSILLARPKLLFLR